jgi:hypothetical protein
MPKGYKGETCAEAYKASITHGEALRFSELVKRVAKRGPWKEETLVQHGMQLVVNLPPARIHWKSAKPFLLVRADGRYELYDAKRHPKVEE